MDSEEALRQAVEEQARSLVAGDLATFASFATPAALARCYGLPAMGKATAFTVERIDASRQPASSVVLLEGAWRELHATWEPTTAGWRATSLAIPERPRPAGWWRRIAGRRSPPAVPEREDLS